MMKLSKQTYSLPRTNVLLGFVHLLLFGAPVAADHLLDAGRRILSALDSRVSGRDHDGPACLPDGECGAGVDADERLLDCDGIGLMKLDELGHGVEDRLQPCLRPLGGGCFPPPVVDGPEAPVFFVDDAVPARSRPWIDADDLHGKRLGIQPDVSFRRCLETSGSPSLTGRSMS